jgi:hypothetical protein
MLVRQLGFQSTAQQCVTNKLKGFVAQKSSAMEVKWQTLTWVDAYLPNLASLYILLNSKISYRCHF